MRSCTSSPDRARGAGFRRGLGAATGLVLALASACTREPEPPRRVVLVSIDTCRADHLSAWGYGRDTTPFLAELSQRGVRFTHAYTQVPDTTPAHASLLTSRYPFAHGAANGVALGEESTTLAEMLRERGFRTAGFVSGATMTARDSGLGQGFETYDDALDHLGSATVRVPNERRAEATTNRALDWLAAHRDEPFFLFVHYFDPHGQYDPPGEYAAMFPPPGPPRHLPLAAIPEYARLGDETDLGVFVARYDGEIRYVDDQLRRLAAGLDERTLLVVTSDHGEGLGEHGAIFHHGWDLFDPALHVPLVMAGPGLPQGLSIETLVQLVDVLPTLLDLLGIDAPAGLHGTSLVARIAGRDEPHTPFVLAKTTKTLTYLAVAAERELRDDWAVRTAEWKYMQREGGRVAALFDLRADPGELRDVSAEHPSEVAWLRALLEGEVARGGGDTGRLGPPLPPEERSRLEERLRALGYLK